MKISRRKILLTIILAIVLVIVFGFVVMLQNHAILEKRQNGDETLTRDEVTHTLEDIKSNWNTMELRITEQYKVDAMLSAMAVRNIIKEENDEAISLYTNGAVIKAEDGTVIAPDDVAQKLGLSADLFRTETGLFASPKNPATLVVYSLISRPFYYVEWHEDTSIPKEVEEAIDIPGILQRAETMYDVYALCVAEDPLAEGGKRTLYKNAVFEDLDESFTGAGSPDVVVEKNEDENSYESGTVTLQNGTFHYVRSAVPEISGYLVLLSLEPNLYIKALGQSSFMFAALILILAALITSGIALYYYVERNELLPDMEKRYAPANIRRFAALCGIIGAIIIFLSGMLIYALNDLYDNVAKGKNRLQMLDQNLQMYTERYEQNMSRFKDIYLDFGTHITEVLDNYPALREKSVLETLANSISASSITLYDKNGNETVSSGSFINLSLGHDPSSTTYDFRRLLSGVPSIVHDQEIDEITGLNEIRIGLRIKDESNPSEYGAVIISVDPEVLASDLQGLMQSVLQNLSGPDTTLCIADPETGEILLSDSDELVGAGISALGLNENHLKGSLIKHTNIDDSSCFIISSLLGTYSINGIKQAIAYYITEEKSSPSDMLFSALTGCLMFIAIYALLAWLLLKDYTDDYFEKCIKENEHRKHTQEGWAGIRNYLSSIRPERTGLITMEFVIALYLIQQIPIANFKTKLARNSLYYYLTSGSWEKGLNLFALTGILFLLGQIVLVVIGIRLVLAACSTFCASKGKTICRLIRSITTYVALFAFLIISCTYIGISMTVIVAALGTLGIAVSLGAQHFVSDIIAGLTIVFEGIFHVGDVVDLAGPGSREYHGEVIEIGLRFVRLKTRHGNIVTLSNRDINMVNNMTQLNSRYECKLALSSEYSIDEIEEMLQRELPKISEMDRRILAGPTYNGITQFENGTMTLSIMTECSEEDLFDVQQIVNRSLQRIFRENGYRI